MLPPALPDIFAAFEEFLKLPVMGPVAVEIWKALDLDYLQESVFGTLALKAALTANDKQLHSAMFVTPLQPDFQIMVTMLTWPRHLYEVRDEAREQFFTTVGRFGGIGDFAGLLQFELFLSENEPHKLRMAWIPFGKKIDDLPESLRKSLLPWGTGMPTSKVEEPLKIGGREIVELAEVAWELSRVMDELRIALIGEEQRQRFGIREAAQERVLEVVKSFNPAASKAGLSHSMPLSRFDDTWLRHNLDNALRFQSLPATLKADLLRVWGKDARDRFAAAWALLNEVFPNRPTREALNELIEAPLALDPEAGAEFTPRPVDVFISYAWSDKTRGARDIFEFVRQSEVSAWLDEEQRLGDAQLNDEIAAAMLRSKRIVICVSLEMFTRGGYVLREVLLAISFVPERCVIVRLDRNPLPQIFNNSRVINWFEHDGPAQLATALRQSVPFNVLPANQMLKLEGPIVENLIALLKRSSSERRHFDAPNRRAEFLWRGKLCSVVSQIWRQYEEADWDGLVKAVPPDLLKWTALNGPAVQKDPTVLGGAVRLRSFLFRSHVQLGAQDDWKSHNHDAYDLLDEILNLDLELLRPLPDVGWLTNDCRLAHQDCLDTLSFAQEWFRGWSPQTLVSICDVPSDSAATVEWRLLSRMTVLTERMMALRAWQDTLSESEPVPPWTTMWTTLREDLTQKLQAGAHPLVKEYFETLSRTISPTMIEELATAMADSAIESRYTKSHREELFFGLPDFRLRCVIHSCVSLENKHAALQSFRGTVLPDLRGPGSEDADLSILFGIFTQRDLTSGDWGYGLYLNCAASEVSERAKRLPSSLQNPFLTAEMLNDDERQALITDDSNVIYEEF